MLPDNVLSTIPVLGGFINSNIYESSDILDFESGGIGLSDTSMGNQYQLWRGELSGDDIILSAPEVEPTIIYSVLGLSAMNFAFDSNMRPVLAYVQYGIAKFRWYDTSIPSYDIIEFPGAMYPRVTTDDLRESQSSNRDIILAYIIPETGHLYTRLQRDRFLIEYEMAANLEQYKLMQVGMNDKYRLQFLFRERS